MKTKEEMGYVKLTDYQLRLLDILSNAPRQLSTREVINIHNALYEPRSYYLIWTSLKRARDKNLIECNAEYFKYYTITPLGRLELNRRRGKLYEW